MTDPTSDPASIAELLHDSPSNWGRWGEHDEVGALNFLTPDIVLQAARTIRSGKTFTLQAPVGTDKGDPTTLSRTSAIRRQVADASTWYPGGRELGPGAPKFADDAIDIYLQGTTQVDALGHAWYGDQIWNGYDETTTIGGLDVASVAPLARHGIVGRGVLLDMARHRGVEVLGKRDTFDDRDLEACAAAQGVELRPHDIIVIRTGVIGSYWSRDRDEFYADWSEPGLEYRPELVKWFHKREIPCLVTDTMGNEITLDPTTGFKLLLHNALMRNLGIVMTELTVLDELADDCAADGQWDFLFAAAPILVEKAAGAPVNPIVIK
ncbi:cyclase family protein [Curtobacterium sp. VKM Ac-1376]|uniref:cyclase family protein n=1 Tax=Curtobacterium sp. VKM Ac-1376 TaxID=123312 RepID=UPI00188DAA16|nr:cyclase family protein [Curtobacterium sp. VKM Ac-1376]MBF4616378.1 cyclase family protein [Curtobacterium sp. VKM Ac-1376]